MRRQELPRAPDPLFGGGAPHKHHLHGCHLRTQASSSRRDIAADSKTLATMNKELEEFRELKETLSGNRRQRDE
jgi:hypothetical protein